MTNSDNKALSLRALIRHVGVGAILTLTQAFSGFAVAAINVREMTSAEFAGVAVFLAVITGVIQMMGSALATLATRESAQATKGDHRQDTGVLPFLTLAGIFSMFAAYFLANSLAQVVWENASDLSYTLVGISAALGTSTVISSGLLQGLGRPLRAHVGVMAQSVCTLSLCLLAVAVDADFTLNLIMAIYAAGSAVVAVWSGAAALRTANRERLQFGSISRDNLGFRLRFLLPLWVSVGLSALTVKIPTIFAGLVFAPALVVAFAIALQFGGLARALPSILSRSLSRSIQQAYLDKNHQALKSLVRKGELIASASVLLIIVGFCVLGRIVLDLGFQLKSDEAFFLVLAMIVHGGLGVIVSIRQGMLGMLGFTIEVMFLRVLELLALVVGFFAAFALGLGVWWVVSFMLIAFLLQAAAGRILMRRKMIFG